MTRRHPFIAPLLEELDKWRDAGRFATLWWRDDDAASVGRAVNHLAWMCRMHGVPLVAAVIPAKADPQLTRILGVAGALDVVAHGFAHENHAPPGEKKQEFGPHRHDLDRIAELVRGRELMESRFGARFRPVFVPPWNRFDPALAGALQEAGYAAFSAFGPREKSDHAGLVIANTHVDLIDWRGTRTPRPGDAVARELGDHLRKRRKGRLPDPDEPTGLLTHHLMHDQAAWGFLSLLFDATRGHGAARWLGADEVFARARVGEG